MANDLRIIITGQLNIEETKDQINSQLLSLAKNINKLNLGVNIDTTTLRELSSQIKQIQNQLNINKELKIFNADETRRWYASVQEAVKEYSKLGTVNVLKNIDPATNKIRDFTLEIKKATGELEKVKFNPVRISDGTVAFQEEAKKIIDKTREINEKQLQLRQQINAKIEKENEKSLQRQLQEQDRVAKILNQRMQSALNLGVKFNNLSPENTRQLERQLERYKKIIKDFQEKNQLGITISDSQLTKLQNLENRIKRLYDTIRIVSRDTQGFDFTKFEKLDNILRQTTNANEYFHKSLIEGKKLLDANVQTTNEYIKVSQRLRDGSQITNLTAYINRATGETYKFSEAQRDLMTRTWDLGSAVKNAAEKFGLWLVVGDTIMGIQNAIQSLLTTIVELDTKLTEMQKVLSSGTDLDQLMSESVLVANSYGRSLQETTEALVEYGKAGYEAEEAMKLLNATLLGSNVMGIKVADTASYLTGILQQMNLTASDAVAVVDKLNEVDNNFAVTSAGLAQALAKSSESAQQFGVTLDDLIGMITSVATATRESGSVIGNFLKTAFARLNMESTQQALESIGVAVRDTNGDLRDATSIYADVAAIFDNLTRSQRTMVAEALAGKYHITRMLALLDGWELQSKAAATAQNSLGSALEENERHMQSLEAKIAQTTSALQELSYTIGESGLKSTMSATLTETTTFIKGLTEIISSGSGLAITIGGLVAVLGALTIGLRGAATTAPLLATGLNIVSGGFATLTASVKAFTLSLASNPFGLLAVGIATAASAFIYFNGVAKEAREETEVFTNKLIDNWSTQRERITELIDKYEKLSKVREQSGALSNEQEEEYLQIQNDLGALLPTLISHYDGQGRARLKNVEAIKQEIEAIKELNELQRRENIARLSTNVKELESQIKNVTSWVEQQESAIASILERLSDPNIPSKLRELQEESLQEGKANLFQYQRELRALQLQVRDIVDQTVNDLLEINEVDINAPEFTEVLQEIKNSLDIEDLVNGNTIPALENVISQIKYLQDTFKSGAFNPNDIGINAVLDQLKKQLKDVFGLDNSQINKFIDYLYTIRPAAEDAAEGVKELTASQEDLEEAYKNTSSIVSDLNSLLQDQAEGKQISAEKVAELISKESDLIDIFEIENGTIKINTELAEERRKSIINSLKEVAEQELIATKQTQKAVIYRISSYLEEMKTVEDLWTARDILNKKIEENEKRKSETGLFLFSDPYGDKLKADRDEIDRIAKERADIEKRLKILTASLNSIGISSSQSRSSKSEYTALTAQQKALEQLDTQLALVQQRKEQYPQSSQEYRKALEDEKKIIQQKIALYQKELASVEATNKIGGKSNKKSPDAKDADEAFKRANELRRTIAELQSELNQVNFDIVNSQLENFAHQNEIIDDKIRLNQERMNSYLETSQHYRDALEIENKYLKQKQNNLHQAANLIRNQLAVGGLTVSQTEELNDKLRELGVTWTSIQNTINDNVIKQVNSQLGELKENTDSLTKSIELSQAKMDLIADKSSQAYLDEYGNFVRLSQEKINSIQNEIAAREKLIQLHQQDIELVKTLRDEIIDLQIQQAQIAASFNQSVISPIIDLYKDIYSEQEKAALEALEREEEKENERHEKRIKHLEEEQKKKEEAIRKEIDAIEEQIDKEEEYHDKVMDDLDEQLGKYREIVNERLKSIDREVSEREYLNRMEELQQERQELLNKINVLSLDDSYEAQLRLAELKKQLADKEKEIEDLAYERGVELRRDNLNDLLDDYEKQIEEKKKAEEEKFKETKKQLEQEKKKLDQQLDYYKDYYDELIDKENEKHRKIIDNIQKEKEETKRMYQELINDEKRYADLRQQILKGNLTAIYSDLEMFKSMLTNNMISMGEAIKNNLIAKIEEAKRAISELNRIPLPSPSGGGGSGGGTPNTDSERARAWQEYLENKRIATKHFEQTGIWPENLRKRNDELRKKYGFPDGTYEELKNLKMYHTGGIVGGKGDRLTELVNDLFQKRIQLKPNEQLAKVLNGELFVTPQNIAQNFIPNIQNLMSNLTPVVNSANTSGGGGDIKLNITIEKFMGTQADYEKFANFVMNKIVMASKKRGR